MKNESDTMERDRRLHGMELHHLNCISIQADNVVAEKTCSFTFAAMRFRMLLQSVAQRTGTCILPNTKPQYSIPNPCQLYTHHQFRRSGATLNTCKNNNSRRFHLLVVCNIFSQFVVTSVDKTVFCFFFYKERNKLAKNYPTSSANIVDIFFRVYGIRGWEQPLNASLSSGR